MEQLRTDYLVVGCGAMALAFLDVMVRETDATFVVTDRRDMPGGHWNDAYPFVRLHQPSSYYGVASRPLGRDRIEASGMNEGLFELATGTEVLSYLHDVMNETLLPSGRVTYLPLSEYREDGSVVSLMTGETHRVDIAGKLVDGRRIATQIPLTHRRRFEVAAGVDCIAPNDLPRCAPGYSGFVVMGSGKTAMDTVLWLLRRGADPAAITWVRPRDAWMINRLSNQPGLQFFDHSIGGQVRQLEILACVRDTAELCEMMEAERFWLRIDTQTSPQMFHAAVTSEREVEAMRKVRDVVRMGHVRAIEPGRLVLDEGEVAIAPGRLFIDCTASAAGGNVDDRDPVFSPGRINLQMIRPYQPTFSAALIGHIEASVTDEELKRRATAVTPMIDTVEDWVERRLVGAFNQAAWNSDEGLRAWVRGCRLDFAHMVFKELDPNDTDRREGVRPHGRDHAARDREHADARRRQPRRAGLALPRHEGVDRLGGLPGLLAHPPMARAFQDGDLGPGAGGRTARHRLAAAKGILRRDDSQPRSCRRRRQAGAQFSHGRLPRRPVERQDCPSHLGIRGRDHLSCDRRAHPQALVALGAGLRRCLDHLRHRLFADPGRLPGLGQIVPDVIGIEDAQHVRRPRPDQFGSLHRDAHDMPAAPVVADEVDRLSQPFKLTGQPVAIGVAGAVEVGR